MKSSTDLQALNTGCEFASNIVFFGDTHGFIDDENLKDLIIKKFGPQIILAENPDNSHMIPLDIEFHGYPKEIYEKLKSGAELSKKELNIIDDAQAKRSEHHIKTIKKYEKKKIFVIIGAWHLRVKSPIRKTFPKATYIYPADNKGNEVLEPKEGIEYWIRQNEEKVQAKKFFASLQR